MQHQLLGRRLVAAPGLQEDQQRVPQPGVMFIVGAQAPQRGQHPGPQQLRRAEHHRHRRDLAERHHPRRDTRGQRDGLRGQSLLVRQAEPGDAPGRVTEGEMQVAVHSGGGSGGVEPVPDPQRQPGPGTGFVAGQEHRLTGARYLRGDVADRMLQPGDAVGGGRRAGRPAHQAHVILAQPAAQGGFCRAHADPLTGQQVPDPGRPRRVPSPQPALPLPGVGSDHLFGGLVDVPGHDPRQAQRGRDHHLGVTGVLG